MSTIQDYYKDRYADEQGPGHQAEPTFVRRVNKALEAIDRPNQRVLDFGCNIGGASRIFAAAGHVVTGVDISDSAVNSAQARVPEARFKRIDSEACLPFEDRSFDVCFCSEVIEHLFDVQRFVSEIKRVLADDGLFLITTPFHGWIKNLLVVTTNFEGHFAVDGGHIRFFTERSMRNCLQAAGFGNVRFSGIGRAWPVWKSMFVVARKRD